MEMDEYVEITITDPSLATQVSLVVDRDGVRQKIKELRGKWQGRKLEPLTQYVELGDEIRELLKTNKLPIFYHSVIEEAVLTGKITRFNRVMRVAIPHEVLEQLDENSQEILKGKEKYEYALVISPETTIQEVEQAYGDLKRDIGSKFGGGELEGVKQPLSDTINSITEHRKWYWMRHGKQKIKVRKIAEMVAGSKEKEYLYYETVKKGIRSYKKKLLGET